jgi:uncharacterized oligopeptide transporter (OPT) family protein
VVRTCVNVRTNNPFPEGYATADTRIPTAPGGEQPICARNHLGAAVVGTREGGWPLASRANVARLAKPSDDDPSAPNTEKMSCAM